MTATVPQTAPAPDAPPPWLWGARIAALAVTATMLAFGVLSVVGMFAHQERTTSRQFTEPVTRLVVTTGTGDVRIRHGVEGVPIEVVTTTKDSFGTARSSEAVADGALRLTGECRFILLPDNCGVDYDVTLPPGIEVEVNTGTGDTVVDGATAQVTINSGTGDIRASTLQASPVAVQTGTGDVRLQFSTPPDEVSAHSGIGDITITVPADGSDYRVVAHTGIGTLSDHLPHDDLAPRTIRAESGTGYIRLDAR